MSYHGFGLRAGWLGVQVFFGISGFLITSLLVEERTCTGRIDLRRFYIRRFLRLMPGYWMFLIGSLAAHFVTVAAVAVSGTYMSDYDLAFGWNVTARTTAEITWSLSVEEKFYFVWPFLLSRIRRRAAAATVAMIAACALWKGWLVLAGAPWIRFTAAFDTNFDFVLWGCLAGLLTRSERAVSIARRVANNVVIGGVALVVVVVFATTQHPMTLHTVEASLAYWDIRMVIFGAAVALLIYLMAIESTCVIARALSLRPLCWLGRISYSLYLWHEISFHIIRVSLGATLNWPLSIGIQFGFAIVVAYLSYRFIELPFLRLKRRFTVANLSSAMSEHVTT